MPLFSKFTSCLMSQSVIAPSKIGPYILRGTVGEGAFSIVKLAYHEQQQQYYACKIVPKSRLVHGNLEHRFEIEIRINQQMHHPGIVGLIDTLKDDFNYYIIMEFCPNGELFQYIVDRNHLTEEDAKPLVHQILETLHYIHGLRVAHRDLKPENILLDQLGHLKLSDFGLSRFVDQNGLASTPCGSPCYASPECISGSPYDGRKSDVWSIGVILYAMLTGQLPWTKRNQTQLFEQIKKGDYQIPNFLSENAKSFLKGLLCVDNNKRLTIPDAFAHPWLADTPDQTPKGGAVIPIISLKKIDLFFEKDTDDPAERISGICKSKQISFQQMQFESVMKAIIEKLPQLVIKRNLRPESEVASARSQAMTARRPNPLDNLTQRVKSKPIPKWTAGKRMKSAFSIEQTQSQADSSRPRSVKVPIVKKRP